MKIAYDGKRAVRNLTGLGNYSRLVIETLSEAYPEDDHLVYTADMRSNPRLATLKSRHNVAFRHPDRYWAYPKAVWRSWGVTRQARMEGADVYHGLSNEIPFNIHHSKVASVVTIHDVIYRRLPDCYTLPDRLIYDFKYGYSARHADRVIAISEATKRDVMELYEVPEEKIKVIRQGCDASFSHEVPLDRRRELRARLQLPSRFLLQVGTIERRKNLETSIRALTALPDDVHLVAVGNGRKYLGQMLALATTLGVRARIHVYKKISFADLPALYQMSAGALYPSHYEGFGLPVLEALAAGTPVITSNVSSMPEAGGNAAFLIAPDDVGSMTAAALSILDGGPDIQQRIARGKLHAASFATADIAHAIHQTYAEAIAAHCAKK